MYLDFFNFKQKPFSIVPDPKHIYMSSQHEEALANILYGAQSDGGFIVLTGEVGTGKTTIIKVLFEQIPEKINLAFIMNPMMELKDMLATICDDFSVPYDAADRTSVKSLIDKLTDYLIASYRQGYTNVLVIDEAQNLSFLVLEQLRLLTNLETDQHKLLQIVLVGQPELNDLLGKKELRQLEQRIVARYHLNPLSLDDVKRYIAHRLEVAGGSRDLFNPPLIKQIYRYSGGFPRLINLLCDRILLLAYHANKTLPDQQDLIQAVRQIRALKRFTTSIFDQPLQVYLISLLALLGISGAIFLYLWSTPPVSQHTQPDEVSLNAATEQIHKPNLDSNQAELLQNTDTDKNKDKDKDYDGFLLPMNNLKTSFNLAFLPLLEALKVPAAAGKPVCDILLEHQWQCYKSNLTWEKALKLQRQLVIALRHPDGRVYYLTLLGVKGDLARIASGKQQRVVSLNKLKASWTGDITGIFAVPEHYAGKINYGDTGKNINWLVRKFNQILPNTMDLKDTHDQYDQELLKIVKFFQEKNGLEIDGVIGMQTLLQLDILTNQALRFIEF